MTQPVEAQIEVFAARYSAEISEQLLTSRGALRGLFPHGHELVFDNYNALVFAFSATELASDAFLSVAGYPKWITLFFMPGVGLDDPGCLLQGRGSKVRSIRLKSAEQLADLAVQALVAQAIEPHREALTHAGPLNTVIKSVSTIQRPRKPGASRAKHGTAG